MVKVYTHKISGQTLYIFENVKTVLNNEVRYMGLFDDYKPATSTQKNLDVNYSIVKEITPKQSTQLGYIKLQSKNKM